MEVLDTLVAVIPLLGILIVVHELGHFLVAKACGVRVLKFSIGVGAPIGFGKMRLRWERGGTEYVIGWIPLGGFVRMLGEPMPGDEEFAPPVPDDVRPDEFLESKPVWQKLAVVFAGPAMNLLLPVVCFVGILWVGFPWPDAVIGMVEANSPAAYAGAQAGDRVISVDGRPVEWWDEVILPIRDGQPESTLVLEVERKAERIRLEIPVEKQRTRDRYGAVVDTGWIGIAHPRMAALVGILDASSPAAEAGLRSGDLVVAVGDREIEDWEDLSEAVLAQHSGARGGGVVWRVERMTQPAALPKEMKPGETQAESTASRSEELELTLPLGSSVAGLGLVPATILVGNVTPDRPAALSGIEAGDLILAVDGEEVGSFESFVSLVQTSGGREMEITLSRDGEVQTTRLKAREETVAGLYDIEGMEEVKYQIGLLAQLSRLPGERGVQQIRNPIESLPRAAELTWQMTVDYLEGLGKFITGDVTTAKLSGPIGIARIARKSLDRGWLEYLSMMMLISINLGVLNLLPIPVLDGGQAVIYGIEGIKRSPLSMRSREITSSMGFAVLVLLMGRAFWNDLTPFWTRFVSWLSSGMQ
jgi:regulator of sigma E protease